LIPGAKLKIRVTPLSSANTLHQIVDFEYLDVKIPETATRKIKAKKSGVLRNL
jgi:hypothetical protein